jgi:hypothetical protein
MSERFVVDVGDWPDGDDRVPGPDEERPSRADLNYEGGPLRDRDARGRLVAVRLNPSERGEAAA